MVVELQLPGGQVVNSIASPLKIPTQPVQVRLPPPLLGQQTEEILNELLGYNSDNISELREQSVI
jgi:crotonobetainyl-CoA:carnitine CoA-transferase CaiB-like acyl-CoA transferase